MPARPAWFHRLHSILEDLRSVPASHLDRQAVERLFAVSERRARQLMAGLPGLQVGNAFAVERAAFIERLEASKAGGPFQWEVARRQRLVEQIDRAHRQAAAARILIPCSDNVRERKVDQLAAGIELHAGELRVIFRGAEDLAAKLFELSQAMANDWEAFAARVEDRSGDLNLPIRAADLGVPPKRA